METATQTLHRLTSVAEFDEERVWEPPVDDPRVVHGLAANDLDRLPWFYKRYDDRLPRIELPRDLPPTTASTVEVLAGSADVPRRELDLPQLGRLLHLSAGVVRTSPRRYGDHLFRAAGSAGGRFPLATAAQRAGDRDELGPAWEFGPAVDVSVRESPPVEDVVRRRGSQRLMDPTASLPDAMLRTSIASALRGVQVPHWVAVHRSWPWPKSEPFCIVATVGATASWSARS